MLEKKFTGRVYRVGDAGGDGIVVGELLPGEAVQLANALRLIRRHEKIGLEEIWVRRHARMAV